jgi:hypothetical protein
MCLHCHTVTVATQIRDLNALEAACRRLNLPQPKFGTHQLWAGQHATGFRIQLPAWNYPVVIDHENATATYDNYGGAWGDIAELHKLTQAYAVELERQRANQLGYAVTETTEADGTIQLTCTSYGN